MGIRTCGHAKGNVLHVKTIKLHCSIWGGGGGGGRHLHGGVRTNSSSHSAAVCQYQGHIAVACCHCIASTLRI